MVEYILDLRKMFLNKLSRQVFSTRTYDVEKTIRIKANNTIPGF